MTDESPSAATAPDPDVARATQAALERATLENQMRSGTPEFEP